MGAGGKLARDLLEGFRSRPGRTAVAAVAVAVGAAVLALLLAALASLEATSRRLVAELGADTVAVLPEAGGQANGSVGLRHHHARLLRESFPGLVVATVSRSEARTLGSPRPLQVITTGPELALARDWPVVDGRFLDALDVEGAERHLVISHRLAAEWGWGPGQVVFLGNLPFLVVGVVRTQGGALAGQLGDPRLVPGERLVFVPHTVPPLWAAGRGSARDRLDVLYLKAPAGVGPDRAAAAAGALLETPFEPPGALSWVTPATLVERLERLKKALAATAGGLSLLCLLLGGTTLMSLMVSNIQERVAEIGLRRALGATRGEITALFLAEALALTVAGALSGTALAHGLVALSGPALPIPVATGWVSWALPLGVSVAFGLLFSLAPARRAARIEPALALRAE